MRMGMLFKQVFEIKITLQASSHLFLVSTNNIVHYHTGGGGEYSGFKVTGIIEWGQKSKHPKSLGLQTKPQKNSRTKI